MTLVGCYGGERAMTGACPAGEVCSPATPRGLQFVGAGLVDRILLEGPSPTAIGGTQDIALQYERDDGVLIALDLPYNADDDGGAGVTIDGTSGSVVTVRGHGSRTNYLRIVDDANGGLMDRKQLTGAALETIELTPTDFELIPAGMPLAWMTGEQSIGVALSGQVQESTGPQTERLIDMAMQVVLDGATRTAWDTWKLTAAVGSHPVAVTAGDKPTASLDLVVVDHADALTVQADAPTTVAPNQTASVCFTAANAGRYVVGLPWSYTIDGQPEIANTIGRNCISVTPGQSTGTIMIEAAAGGQTATATVAIGAATRERPVRALRSTAGDRAAMY